MAPTTETYRLTIVAFNNSYFQLALNGQVLIQNDFSGIGSQNMYVDYDFTQGQLVSISLSYAQKLGPTLFQLFWESDSVIYEIVPSQYLLNTLYSASTPYLITVIPSITNATTSGLSNNNYMTALVGVAETQTIIARDQFGNQQVNQNDVF